MRVDWISESAWEVEQEVEWERGSVEGVRMAWEASPQPSSWSSSSEFEEEEVEAEVVIEVLAVEQKVVVQVLERWWCDWSWWWLTCEPRLLGRS